MPKELSVSILGFLARHFFSRDELADEMRFPQAYFAPTGRQARCHRNRGNARLRYLHQHARRIENDMHYASKSQA